MAKRKRSAIPGLSFSWRRALGVTKAKRRIAWATGIPTTRSGRRAKMGRMMGCAMTFYTMLAAVALVVGAIVALIAA